MFSSGWTESQPLGVMRTTFSETSRLAAINLTFTRVAGKACASHVMNIDTYADPLQAIEHYEDCDINFLCNHLSLPPCNVCWKQDSEDEGYIAQISQAETKSGKIYVPLARLLNQYSLRIHGLYLTHHSSELCSYL